MGSRAGWFIAAALVFVVLLVGVKLIAFPSPSPPTSRTTRPGALSFKPFKADPAALIGRTGEGDENAARYYMQAAELAHGSRDEIRQLATRTKALTAGQERLSSQQLELFERIAQQVRTGASQRQMRLAPEHMPKDFKIGPAGLYDLTGRLQKVLQAQTVYADALVGQGDHGQAQRVLQDTLVMGYHLVEDRARAWTVKIGMGIQQAVCEALIDLYNTKMNEQKPLVPKLQEYLAAVRALSQAYMDKESFLWNYSQIKQFPGDVLNAAEHDQDHAWRVEAIGLLGVVKYVSGQRGDRRYVQKLLQRYARSSDPLEAAAAAAAQALTLEEYRRLGSPLPESD